MLIHRLFRHLTGLYRLASSWSDLNQIKRKIYGCITVDLDAYGHRQAFELGVPFLLSLYEKMELKGKVTWFVNCQENMIDKNAPLLRQIIDQGYDIGMHSHLELLSNPEDPNMVSARLESDKRRLEAFLGQKVHGFRSGRFFRTQAIIDVLPELNFLYDSSFTYGRVFRVGNYTMDDSKILGYDSVFIHSNGLLEFPVWEPYPDPGKISLSKKPYFITTMVHPYNMVSMERNGLLIQFYYRQLLKILSKIPGIEFIPLEKSLSVWNACSEKKDF